jgi:hypothetical protein
LARAQPKVVSLPPRSFFVLRFSFFVLFLVLVLSVFGTFRESARKRKTKDETIHDGVTTLPPPAGLRDIAAFVSDLFPPCCESGCKNTLHSRPAPPQCAGLFAVLCTFLGNGKSRENRLQLRCGNASVQTSGPALRMRGEIQSARTGPAKVEARQGRAARASEEVPSAR